MAGLINLRLLTDFFNKIGPQRRLLRRSHYVRSWGEADMLTSLNRRD